ncbi:hypothetical protein [Tolypothrix campylonemoides]
MTDKYLQLAHKIAVTLIREQDNIEAGEKGIITEVGKLTTYLNYKIKQNISLKKEERKQIKFFIYLDSLSEHSQTIGHSNKTIAYYEAINETCKNYLKDYANKPVIMMQILGWSQRLMYYYRQLDLSNIDINNLQIETTDEMLGLTPKLSEINKITEPIVTQTSKTLTLPQKLQVSKPIPPQVVESTQTETNNPLKRPISPKPAKPVESPKLEKPKASESSNPFKRPPKKISS